MHRKLSSSHFYRKEKNEQSTITVAEQAKPFHVFTRYGLETFHIINIGCLQLSNRFVRIETFDRFQPLKKVALLNIKAETFTQSSYIIH